MGHFKIRKGTAVLGMLLAVPAVGIAAPSLAQASLAMLDSLDSGAWEVRFRDGSAARKLCVRNGRELIQLRHAQAGCNRFVVEDGKDEVTVQYTCRGDGYGRTSVRKEGADLVQIDSQGIAGGRPFQFSAEARRTGRCR